ncbi:hypothetical protein D9M72_531080 [compost metagenome]
MTVLATGSARARSATMAVSPMKSNPSIFPLLTMRPIFAPFVHSKSRMIARSKRADTQSETAAMTKARCAATAPSKRASSNASVPVRARFKSASAYPTYSTIRAKSMYLGASSTSMRTPMVGVA